MSEANIAFEKHSVLAPIVQKWVNFQLAPDHVAVCRCLPDSPAWCTLGDYYLVSVQDNDVIGTHVNLESMARELDVLAEWETVEEG